MLLSLSSVQPSVSKLILKKHKQIILSAYLSLLELKKYSAFKLTESTFIECSKREFL